MSYSQFLFSIIIFCFFQISFSTRRFLHEKSSSTEQELSVAICSVVGRNSLSDITEWVDYHSFLGVSKIYVIYHGVYNVKLLRTLKRYIFNGTVEVHYISHAWSDDIEVFGISKCGPSMQCWGLTYCLRQFRHRHHFMAMIDVDEFILIRNSNVKLPAFLSPYLKKGGLTLHWRVFGSSGHISRPHGGVLRNYVRCNENETFMTQISSSNPVGHTKGIVNTRFTNSQTYCNPHRCFQSGDDLEYYNEFFQRDLNVTFKHISLNHYRIKSKFDFESKSRFSNSIGGHHVNLNYFHKIDQISSHDCSEARKYAIDFFGT